MKDEMGLATSCRIAGGWVRDKVNLRRPAGTFKTMMFTPPFAPQLLGSQSNDIDIALEDMMGVAFAEHFASFVSSQKNIPVKAIAKIERNPDQSKHLETAKTTVLDTELDFVNLRSEEYAGDSRIPTEIVSTHIARVAPARVDSPRLRHLVLLFKMPCGEISLSMRFSTMSTLDQWRISLRRYYIFDFHHRMLSDILLAGFG
jgi:hypothetical protein